MNQISAGDTYGSHPPPPQHGQPHWRPPVPDLTPYDRRRLATMEQRLAGHLIDVAVPATVGIILVWVGVDGDLVAAFTTALLFCYFTPFMARHGATPGQRIANLQMVRASTGSPRIGWPRAVARCTAQLLVTGALTAVSPLAQTFTGSETTQFLVEFGVTAAILTWVMAEVGAYYGTRDRQFLHDLIGDTVVLSRG